MELHTAVVTQQSNYVVCEILSSATIATVYSVRCVKSLLKGCDKTLDLKKTEGVMTEYGSYLF